MYSEKPQNFVKSPIIDRYYIGQIYGEDLQKFEAFSEYMNFNNFGRFDN